MKKISVFAIGILLACGAYAQGDVTYKNPFPVIEENIEWQRDVYREVNLMNDNNAGLYVLENNDNLLMRIFSLVLADKIPAYEFSLNQTEAFTKSNTVKIREVMNDHAIYYVNRDSLTIKDVDVPTDEVKSYYIKERHFFDIANGMFRTKVVGICPVINRTEEFNGTEGVTKYPLFWISFDDIAPYIASLMVSVDNYNMVAKVPAVDYFNRNLYSGEIYKVFNSQGTALTQYCKDEPSLLRERRRIENELSDIRTSTYNIFETRK